MTTTQILLYSFLIIVTIFYLRRMLAMRSIPNYTASGVAEMQSSKANIVLLDVRTGDERSRRHIKGSIHIPLHELRNRIAELEKFKEKEIICYCQSGSRSASAAMLLKKNGFKVANLSGGISSWTSES